MAVEISLVGKFDHTPPSIKTQYKFLLAKPAYNQSVRYSVRNSSNLPPKRFESKDNQSYKTYQITAI